MTRHHVTAHLTPGASSIVVDGVDLSTATTKAGTSIHFDHQGQPVLTMRAMSNVTIDLDAEDAKVHVIRSNHRLRALDVLAAAGIEADDAVTALDSLLVRLGAEIVDVDPQHLAGRFGSDACRPAAVLARAAEIRAELKKAGVAPDALDAAVLGTLRLARSGHPGTHEAIDTTLEALRRHLLDDTDQDTEGDPA